MSGARTLGATYSRPKGGRVPSPLGARARPLSLLAALFSHILMQRGLRFAPSLRALGFHNVLWPRQASLTYLPWRGPSLLALEKRCAGPSVVRPCLPPVGRAQDFG
jgi:hypothetical protein